MKERKPLTSVFVGAASPHKAVELLRFWVMTVGISLGQSDWWSKERPVGSAVLSSAIGPFQNWPTSPIGCPMICWRASPLQILCLQNCFNLLTNFVFTFLIVTQLIVSILCLCVSANWIRVSLPSWGTIALGQRQHCLEVCTCARVWFNQCTSVPGYHLLNKPDFFAFTL